MTEPGQRGQYNPCIHLAGVCCYLRMTEINLIWAQARHPSGRAVIGNNGGLPWHLPEDLAHFKLLTSGWPVIMGRKTWDSLPARFRPLPGRTNLVITRQPDWSASGAVVASNLQHALGLCAAAEQAWIIGGAQIYAQAEPLAQRVEVTEIEHNFEGDAFAPLLGADWAETARESGVSSGGLNFSFITYNKPRNSHKED